jgi:hypothetical protein
MPKRVAILKSNYNSRTGFVDVISERDVGAGGLSPTPKGCRRVLAAIQPVYLPWLGYFEQIAAADVFALIDDVKFSRFDWRNRNRIYGVNGPMWLTVPVKHEKRMTLIKDAVIISNSKWNHRHLKSIEQSYGKCRYFRPLFDDLFTILESPPTYLVDLNEQLIRVLCRYLDINSPITRTSGIPRLAAKEDKTGRVIEFCEHYQAEVIYIGQKAATYLDTERVLNHGTKVIFQDYLHPVYKQRFSPFVSHLSAIDLIFNTGEEAAALLRSSQRYQQFRRRSEEL